MLILHFVWDLWLIISFSNRSGDQANLSAHLTKTQQFDTTQVILTFCIPHSSRCTKTHNPKSEWNLTSTELTKIMFVFTCIFVCTFFNIHISNLITFMSSSHLVHIYISCCELLPPDRLSWLASNKVYYAEQHHVELGKEVVA